jgi:hypothetical protein
LFIIEEYSGSHDNPTKNPNYHTVNDALSTLNLSFHAKVTQALVASLATFANP